MTKNKKLNYLKIFLTYLQVVIISLVVNVALFFIGKQLGGFSEDLLTPNLQSVGLNNIIAGTFSFPIIGVIVFIITAIFAKNPKKLFRVLGYTFILINVIGPLQLENAVIWDKIILEIMHLVVGVQFIELYVRSFPKLVTENMIEGKK